LYSPRELAALIGRSVIPGVILF